MKNKKKININLVKRQQFMKYSSYDIPLNILEKSFNQVKDIPDEMELIFAFQKLVNEYIVEELKKDNIDLQIIIIEKNQYVKKLIVKNPKYNLPAQDIDSIYDQAIELLKNRFNRNELISNNILDNMKYIILKNNKQIDNNEETYDMSFFKKYIELYEIDINDYIPIFGYTREKLLQMLSGTSKFDKNDILLLCSIFDTDSFESFKKLIEEKNDFFIKKEQILVEKNKNNNNIKYDMSFMKVYVDLYKINKKVLASLWQCGYHVVDKILNGLVKIPENLLFDTLEYFKVNSYEELKNKIKISTENIKNNNKKDEEIVNNTEKEKEKKRINIESFDENKIFDILNVSSMNTKDCLITLMLFGKDINKSVDEISSFLSINKSYVLKVYINELDQIKNNLLKYNKNLILLHKNEEID